MDNAIHITQFNFKYGFCISLLHNALFQISEEVRKKKSTVNILRLKSTQWTFVFERELVTCVSLARQKWEAACFTPGSFNIVVNTLDAGNKLPNFDVAPT